MIRAGLLLAVAVASAAPGGALAEKRKPADACAAAKAPVNYGRLVQIPAPLKAEVEAYRQGWREACAKKGGSSLSALLARADRIEKGFAAVAAKANKEPKYAELHELWQNTYPTFIPAFQGSIIEFEYFEADLEAFARHAELGNAEDKLFLSNRRALYGTDGHAFPWIERTWDHGGCVKFGQYDWVAAIARIETLEDKLHAEPYRTRLKALKERISNYLGDPAAKRDGQKPVVDSCASHAATIAALEKTQRALAGRKGWERVAAGLAKTLGDIRANRTAICKDCLR